MLIQKRSDEEGINLTRLYSEGPSVPVADYMAYSQKMSNKLKELDVQPIRDGQIHDAISTQVSDYIQMIRVTEYKARKKFESLIQQMEDDYHRDT